MVKGELRSHFAQHMPGASEAPLTDLAARVDMGEDPPLAQRLWFAQATADALNFGLLNPEGPNPDRRQSSFVDDSGNAHVRRFFRPVINASVRAAYHIFGSPTDDPNRPPCINPIKWVASVSFLLKYLGYIIDTRRMIVICRLTNVNACGPSWMTSLSTRVARIGEDPRPKSLPVSWE